MMDGTFWIFFGDGDPEGWSAEMWDKFGGVSYGRPLQLLKATT